MSKTFHDKRPSDDWQEVSMEYDDFQDDKPGIEHLSTNDDEAPHGGECDSRSPSIEMLESLLLNESTPNDTSDEESVDSEGTEDSDAEETMVKGDDSESEQQEADDEVSNVESRDKKTLFIIRLPFWKTSERLNITDETAGTQHLVRTLEQGIKVSDSINLVVEKDSADESGDSGFTLADFNVEVAVMPSTAPRDDRVPQVEVSVASGPELQKFLSTHLLDIHNTNVVEATAKKGNEPNTALGEPWYVLARDTSGNFTVHGFSDIVKLVQHVLDKCENVDEASQQSSQDETCPSATCCSVTSGRIGSSWLIGFIFALPLLLCISGLACKVADPQVWQAALKNVPVGESADVCVHHPGMLDVVQFSTSTGITFLAVHAMLTKNPRPLVCAVLLVGVATQWYPEYFSHAPIFGAVSSDATSGSCNKHKSHGRKKAKMSSSNEKQVIKVELSECRENLAVVEDVLSSTNDKYKTLLEQVDQTDALREAAAMVDKYRVRHRRLKEKVENKVRAAEALERKLEKALELCGSWCSEL